MQFKLILFAITPVLGLVLIHNETIIIDKDVKNLSADDGMRYGTVTIILDIV